MKPVLLPSLCLGLLLAAASAKPPLIDPPPPQSVTDIYHGTEIEDPYRYFEERGNSVAAQWTAAAAAASRQTLDQLPDRERILKLLKQSEQYRGAKIDNLTRTAGEELYLLMQRPEDEVPMLFRKRPHQEPELLLDPRHRVESSTPGIQHFSISPDKRFLAVGIDAGGSENGELHILDPSTGKPVSGPISRARWGPASWLPDSSGFFYTRLQEIGPDDDPRETFQRSTVFLHKVGSDPTEDQPVFGIGVDDGVEPAPADIPFLYNLPGSEWVLAVNQTGVSTDYILHIARLPDLLAGSPRWRKVCDRDDLIGTWAGGIAIHGEAIYLVTRKGAPDGRVVRVALDAPGLDAMETVFQPETGVIREMIWARDGLYLKILDGGPSRLIRLPFDSPDRPEPIATPDDCRIDILSGVGTGSDLGGVLLKISSWTRPEAYHAVAPGDTKSRPLTLGERTEPPICRELVTRRLEVVSHDGTRVPVSLIHRRDLKPDGSHRVLLVGYGAYGFTLEPSLWDFDPALYEMGIIKAVAHIRGGGALGENWRLAGKDANKPNTWKDFIAAAEGLVKAGYTRPELICASGRSAGGITVGRAMTERPDAFGAALIGVGVCDALRMETTPNGVPNIPEFGSVRTPEGFRALHAMSAYHHIQKGTAYPATLIYHGANDTRVELWQSQKMAARLIANHAGEAPVLLRIDSQAGHGRGSHRDQRHQLDADLLAFLTACCRP